MSFLDSEPATLYWISGHSILDIGSVEYQSRQDAVRGQAGQRAVPEPHQHQHVLVLCSRAGASLMSLALHSIQSLRQRGLEIGRHC